MPATPILFCSHVVELGGAEMVLLDLLAELDRDQFEPHLAIPGPGPLTDRAAVLGVKTHEVPLAGNSKLGKARAALRSQKPLRALAQALDCHVLVANSMIAGYAAVLAQQPGLAAIWHLHAVSNSKIAGFSLRRAAQVIAPSQVALDAAAVTNGHCIHNGVPERFFTCADQLGTAAGSLRATHGIDAQAPLLGIIGRLDPHKGHEVLLHSLAGEWPAGCAPHLVIAGGELFATAHARLGGFRDRLLQLVTELSLHDRVHWLGEVADTSTLLPELDVLVVPSISLESAPRTIAEAQAAGCPVVASNVGGIAEMLQHGSAGVLVANGDSDALRLAVAGLLTDPSRRERTVRAARLRAEQQYRLPAFARRCEAVFAQANAAAIATGKRRQ